MNDYISLTLQLNSKTNINQVTQILSTQKYCKKQSNERSAFLQVSTDLGYSSLGTLGLYYRGVDLWRPSLAWSIEEPNILLKENDFYF